MKTKQPIRIVLFFPSQNRHNFYSVPVLVGNGIAVAAVTQLFDKMAEGSIPNKRFRDKPHSSLSCFAMRLKPGQEIRECLLSYVKENNLKAPFVLSCVGSVTSATLRLANASKDTRNEIIEVEGRHEVVSLVGTLADEGHLHAALSDKDGHVVGGHVMGNMKVFTTAEVVIGNCDMLSFTREIDDETGFDELVVKEKV